jgi:hypothetical protein
MTNNSFLEVLMLRLVGNELMTLPTKFFSVVGLSMYLCNTPTDSHLKSAMPTFTSVVDISLLDEYEYHVSLAVYSKMYQHF